MAYPFEHPASSFAKEKATLAVLAETDDPFDPGFPVRLPLLEAYSFDTIKKKVCAYRQAKKEKRLLRSADALIVTGDAVGQSPNDASAALFWFIEFKNQKVDNVQSYDDSKENALMIKAFDSLSLCAMTFGRTISMHDLQKRAVFIVVYPKQNYSEQLLAALGRLADNNPNPWTRRPMWLLDKLLDAGFYRHILTVDDAEFVDKVFPVLQKGNLPVV